MIKRLAARFPCSIEVLACTPIMSVEACIVDLSRFGAQLKLEPCFPKSARIHLDVEGHYYWGMVMWEEGDRMGVRFRTAIADGPLDAILNAFATPRRTAPTPIVAARPTGGFGRRMAMPTG